MCSGASALSLLFMALVKTNPIDEGKKIPKCILFPQAWMSHRAEAEGGRAGSAMRRLMFKDISTGPILTFINLTGGRLRADSTFFLPPL